MLNSYQNVNDRSADGLRNDILAADVKDLNDVSYCAEYSFKYTTSMLKAVNVFSDQLPK